MSRLNFLLIFSVFLLITGCGLQPMELAGETPPLSVENELKQDEDSEHLFYFGYGSNMNHSSIVSRCGAEHFSDLGKAILEDYRFYFYGRGHANIQPQNNDLVGGVLYEIDQTCLQSLDRAEGYPNVYQRKQLSITQGNQDYLAEVYIVLNDNTTSIPSDAYYQIVLTGAQEHNLSTAYINQIKSLAGR